MIDKARQIVDAVGLPVVSDIEGNCRGQI